MADSKYAFENLYEALRELSECVALIKGVKLYSHEDNIKFLKENKIIEEHEFERFDSFRRTRNKSKYYGKDISYSKLKESIDDMISLKNKLKDWVEKNV